MTNSIREIRDGDCIFITGSNTAESHPVISYEVVRAAKRGANVIIVDPRRIPLVDHATLFLQAKPGTDIYVFLAIMHFFCYISKFFTDILKIICHILCDFINQRHCIMLYIGKF